MHKSLLVGLIGLVALGACTTKKDEATSTTSAATTASTATSGSAVSTTAGPTETTYTPVVDDRAPGVTADTIKIGITYVDFSKLKAVIGFDHGDYETAYNAIIDDINSKGGINGRKLEAVFAPVDPSVSDAAPAACTKLTQDDKVFVALGFFLDDQVLCYVDTNKTIAINGTMTAERLAKAKVAWYTTDSSEDSIVEGFQTLADKGVFSQKLAVVGADSDQANYESAIKPILDAAGITPVDVAYIDSSSGDSNAAADAAETLAERFKSDGADQILLLGNSGGFFPVGLARSDFRPQLIFPNLNSLGTYSAGEGNDLSVLKGAVAAAAYDGNNDYPKLGSPTKECLALQTAAGLTLVPTNQLKFGDSQQISGSLTACRTMALLVAILEKAGPDLNYGTFTTAGNNLGDVMLPGSPDPYHYGPPPHADGDPVLYLFAWDDATKTIKLQG
jgi:ABC-type branched-subunit amino acid transport system substrate-binding protein